MAKERPAGDLGPGKQRVQGGGGIVAELADADRECFGWVGTVAAHIEREHVEAGGVEHLGVGQCSIAVRFPAVDEDDTWPRETVAGGDEPRRKLDPCRPDEYVRERHPAV